MAIAMGQLLKMCSEDLFKAMKEIQYIPEELYTVNQLEIMSQTVMRYNDVINRYFFDSQRELTAREFEQKAYQDLKWILNP